METWRAVLDGSPAGERGGSCLWTRAHARSPGRQGTVIVERWWKVPLAGEGRQPRLHRRHRVYKLVEDTKHRPKDNLELILTKSVDGKAPPLFAALVCSVLYRQTPQKGL